MNLLQEASVAVASRRNALGKPNGTRATLRTIWRNIVSSRPCSHEKPTNTVP